MDAVNASHVCTPYRRVGKQYLEFVWCIAKIKTLIMNVFLFTMLFSVVVCIIQFVRALLTPGLQWHLKSRVLRSFKQGLNDHDDINIDSYSTWPYSSSGDAFCSFCQQAGWHSPSFPFKLSTANSYTSTKIIAHNYLTINCLCYVYRKNERSADCLFNYIDIIPMKFYHDDIFPQNNLVEVLLLRDSAFVSYMWCQCAFQDFIWHC